MYRIIFSILLTNCLETCARVGEPLFKSDIRAVLLEVPMLVPFSKFAAKLPHQAISDPLCGTPKKEKTLAFFNISSYDSLDLNHIHAQE